MFNIRAEKGKKLSIIVNFKVPYCLTYGTYVCRLD